MDFKETWKATSQKSLSSDQIRFQIYTHCCLVWYDASILKLCNRWFMQKLESLIFQQARKIWMKIIKQYSTRKTYSHMVFFLGVFFFSFFSIVSLFRFFFKFISYFLDSCNSTNPSGCSLWTGLNDREVKGQYRWNSSNITMTFSNWHPNEPNSDIRKRCVDMLQNGTWSDRGCWYKIPFVCEMA